MKVSISPSAIGGVIAAPASKSAMQRACALALLHEGETIINDPGISNDDIAAINVIEHLGAAVNKNENGALLVNSSGLLNCSGFQAREKISINCGESGLSFRMFAPIASLTSSQVTINGEGSLLQRPMHFFDEIFPLLGVHVQTADGKLPVIIQGPMQPKNITIDGAISSQFLTGLLLAFANSVTEVVTISVNNLKSKPYIYLTLQMMHHFGYEITHENYERFFINPKALNNKTQTYTVEADWSGASFLLVAGAIAGELTVTGLDVFSSQADKAILQALMMTGINVSISEKQIVVSPSKGNLPKAFQFNATHCPDLFPPLVALASYCEGTTVIEGVSRLEHKESNRAVTLLAEFAKMGVEIRLQDDLMLIYGSRVKGADVDSHHDHRIAMACAVAALSAEGVTTINTAEAVSKSYPRFFEDLKMLNAAVSLPLNQ